MASQDFKRKLTAILSADVEGYSRLMGEDEEATVRTITAYREVMTTLIHQHRGTVVDSPGDNVLAEFASVVDAVQCAVAIQKEIDARNTELPENRQMHFRIGINLGDVIQEGDRIYGDGVNIAARLEGLADPGGICVSKTAFDHIESKLPYGYDFIGDQTVKNISKPVGAYRVLMDPRVTVAGKPKEKLLGPKRRTSIFVGVVAILVLVVVAGIWQFNKQRQAIETASVEKMAYPLPDKPSIAVLPFTNMSEDPKQEYFCDGLTEQIITALSKAPKLFVIARNSVFSYKGKPVKVNQVAEELGVRYVLEGSIRKAGDEIRITAQLIDALTGHHLWAEQYDRNLKDIFAVQDEITQKIIIAMQVKLTRGEQARVAAKDTNNLEAYLKWLQALDYILQFNKESVAMAQRLSEEAIELDPAYASAYRLLGITHLHDVFLGRSKSPKESMANAIKYVKKAIEMDDSDAYGHSQLGMLSVFIKQYDKAVSEGELAVNLNPNYADCHAYLGLTYRYVGRWEDAIEEYKKATRLNPIPPTWYLYGFGLAYAMTGQYEEGIRVCKKAIQQAPNSPYPHLHMTMIYGLAGLEEEARAQAEELLRINPKFSLEHWGKRLTYKNQSDKEQIINALLMAGMK
jgi:adenylate cyclase